MPKKKIISIDKPTISYNANNSTDSLQISESNERYIPTKGRLLTSSHISLSGLLAKLSLNANVDSDDDAAFCIKIERDGQNDSGQMISKTVICKDIQKIFFKSFFICYPT